MLSFLQLDSMVSAFPNGLTHDEIEMGFRCFFPNTRRSEAPTRDFVAVY